MRWSFLFSALLVSTLLAAQLRAPIDQFIHSSVIDGCNVSCLSVNLTTGDTLFSYNPHQRVVPASLLKLFTTSAALEEWGSDYRFKSAVGYRGVPSNGVLDGDLVVHGFGDPTLGSSHFASTHPDTVLIRTYNAINSAGIRSVKGDIILLNGYFDDNELSSGRLFEDMANYYGATPKSFNWRDNSFILYLKSPQKVNKKCRIVGTEPHLEMDTLISNVYSSTINRDSAYIYPIPNGFVVRGSIPTNQDAFPVKGVLPSPAGLFGSELLSYLGKNGVQFSNSSSVKMRDDSIKYTPIYTLFSPPLQEIITVTNQKSINLFADALLLHLAKKNTSRWQWSGGSLELMAFWKSRIASDLVVEDGSGVSPRNLVTASQVVDMLTYQYQSEKYSQFKASLSIAGVNGTLKRSFISPKWKFYGKSGSMKGVLCYGGYVVNDRGDTMAVAVMVNNYISKNSSVKAVIEKLFIDTF